MDLSTLRTLPPWDWPDDADQAILEVLRDHDAADSDRLLAVELSGEIVVMSDELADEVLAIVRDTNESDELRGRAATSLGPVLELVDMDGFDDPDDLVISEETFDTIQEWFRRLYLDANVPKLVRRRILEASVRSPQDWHEGMIRAAYASDDEDWRLTAVFCMEFVGGFEDEILEAIESENPEIEYHAVRAAGNWEVEGAWPHVVGLVNDRSCDKPLLMSAIEAVGNIRPHEAGPILVDLADSEDEDISELVFEVMAIAEGLAKMEEWDEEDDDDDLY